MKALKWFPTVFIHRLFVFKSGLKSSCRSKNVFFQSRPMGEKFITFLPTRRGQTRRRTAKRMMTTRNNVPGERCLNLSCPKGRCSPATTSRCHCPRGQFKCPYIPDLSRYHRKKMGIKQGQPQTGMFSVVTHNAACHLHRKVECLAKKNTTDGAERVLQADKKKNYSADCSSSVRVLPKYKQTHKLQVKCQSVWGFLQLCDLAG